MLGNEDSSYKKKNHTKIPDRKGGNIPIFSEIDFFVKLTVIFRASQKSGSAEPSLGTDILESKQKVTETLFVD